MFLHALQDFQNYAFSFVPFLQKNDKKMKMRQPEEATSI